MTWAPGEPEIIEGRLIFEGGWKDHPGARCLNLYRPPTIVLGDPAKAGPWIKHVKLRSIPTTPSISATGWRNGCRTRRRSPTTRSCSAALQGIGKDTIASAGSRSDRRVEFPGHHAGHVDRAVQPVRESRDLARERGARPRRQRALQSLRVLRADEDLRRGPA